MTEPTLEARIEKMVLAMLGEIIDYARLAIDSEERYRKLRSRILRDGNDLIEDLAREFVRSGVSYRQTRQDLAQRLNNGR